MLSKKCFVLTKQDKNGLQIDRRIPHKVRVNFDSPCTEELILNIYRVYIIQPTLLY